MALTHGDEVTYDHPRYGTLTGVILDRAPGNGHWWVHTEMRDIFDCVRVWATGKHAGRVDWTSRHTARGQQLQHA